MSGDEQGSGPEVQFPVGCILPSVNVVLECFGGLVHESGVNSPKLKIRKWEAMGFKGELGGLSKGSSRIRLVESVRWPG